MLPRLLLSISSALTVYSLLIMVRIILSWFPQMAWSTPGRFLARVCDPWLNWFRRFRFSRAGGLDFSPVFAMGSLFLASSILTRIGLTGTITAGIVISLILQLIFSFTGFLLNLMLIVLIIRILSLMYNRTSGSHFWERVDVMLYPPVTRIAALFSVDPHQWQKALIITAAVLLIIRILLAVAAPFILELLHALPF